MKESVIDAGLALGKMLNSALEGVDVLPQAQLEQLVAHGRLVSVTTFEDHMRPDVHWIEPEEYGKSFDELIAEGNIMAGQEAAFTSATQSYPGFINATLGLDEMVVTVRSDPAPGMAGSVEPTESDPLGQGPNICGALAQVRIPLADWDAFLVQAQRVRAGTAE